MHAADHGPSSEVGDRAHAGLRGGEGEAIVMLEEVTEPETETEAKIEAKIEPASQPAASAQASTYPPPAQQPTQEGPRGIRFDYNEGCRVELPEAEQSWRVRLSDLDTGNTLYETTIGAGIVKSSKRYYLRCRIEVWAGEESVLQHDYDAAGREVLVQLPVGTVGDTIGWFPYVPKFQEAHRCRLTCAMAEKLIPLFRDAYPEIAFATPEEVEPDRYYASYNIGLFFDDADNLYQPCDFRLVGLHRTAGYILGVDPTEEPPRIALDGGERPLAEPYVCIAVQSTTQCKYWNNPRGWHQLVRFLKDAGYRVVCIDKTPVHGHGLVWNHIPNGVEDETGDRPLLERAHWLKHAEFFIGLSSGLSWLAWAVGTPVVMISGFTHPTNEFATPYRVINYHACNGCWNDPRHRFDHHDFLWCPRHKDTARQFECTRLITPEAVMHTIERIPGFAATRPANGVLPAHPSARG
jgi:autotransporter strand-loop-strand O-heptosyltransferase